MSMGLPGSLSGAPTGAVNEALSGEPSFHLRNGLFPRLFKVLLYTGEPT